MTDADPRDPAARRTALAEAIADHRRSAGESPLRIAAADRGGHPDAEGDGTPGDRSPGGSAPVEYRDREVTVQVDADERERLEELLGEFPVFKLAQPATRKAPDGEVRVSALADPKHVADFLDRLFVDVFECDDEYALAID